MLPIIACSLLCMDIIIRNENPSLVYQWFVSKNSIITLPYLYVLGLKLQAALCCIVAALYQSKQIIDNFNSKTTIWKKEKRFETGEMKTPAVIFCSDPPNIDTDRKLVYHGTSNMVKYTTYKTPIYNFNTIVKVGFLAMSLLIKFHVQGVCNIMESFTSKSMENDRKKKVLLCFKNSTKINIYSVIPGKV